MLPLVFTVLILVPFELNATHVFTVYVLKKCGASHFTQDLAPAKDQVSRREIESHRQQGGQKGERAGTQRHAEYQSQNERRKITFAQNAGVCKW